MKEARVERQDNAAMKPSTVKQTVAGLAKTMLWTIRFRKPGVDVERMAESSGLCLGGE